MAEDYQQQKLEVAMQVLVKQQQWRRHLPEREVLEDAKRDPREKLPEQGREIGLSPLHRQRNLTLTRSQLAMSDLVQEKHTAGHAIGLQLSQVQADPKAQLPIEITEPDKCSGWRQRQQHQRHPLHNLT